MKYTELVEVWNKSREQYMDYKFEVGSAFNRIYQNIAKKLDYYQENKLNDYMKLYPISEINEYKMKTTSYSLWGAITYEKFGWSSIVLQINTNSTSKITQNGVYRFIFYIKKINNDWYYSIDKAPYEEIIEYGQLIYKQKELDCTICSSDEDYIEKATEIVFGLIPDKISWDDDYINNLQEKVIEIKNIFTKHLEINDNKLTFHSNLEKINSNYSYLSYELNDWINCSFSLIIELDKNTYPKTNYIFTFHLKKINNDWYIKLAEEKDEIQVNNEEEINCMLQTFCTFQDTFNRWLTNGEEK